MSENIKESNPSGLSGLIELVPPQDSTFEEPKTLVDFGVIGDMMQKFETRTQENFIIFVKIYGCNRFACRMSPCVFESI